MNMKNCNSCDEYWKGFTAGREYERFVQKQEKESQSIENAPVADVVSREAYEQVRWERDVAIEQLSQIGKGFGEKMDDIVTMRHGRWEWLGPNELVRGCMCGTCSVCKVRSEYITNTAVCPACGARMDLDGGAKDEKN